MNYSAWGAILALPCIVTVREGIREKRKEGRWITKENGDRSAQMLKCPSISSRSAQVLLRRGCRSSVMRDAPRTCQYGSTRQLLGVLQDFPLASLLLPCVPSLASCKTSIPPPCALKWRWPPTIFRKDLSIGRGQLLHLSERVFRLLPLTPDPRIQPVPTLCHPPALW